MTASSPLESPEALALLVRRRRRSGKAAAAGCDDSAASLSALAPPEGAAPPADVCAACHAAETTACAAGCAYYAAARRRGGRRLYDWHEAPAVLRFNPYIRTGYRAGLGARACLCSLGSLRHNEAGNVLTHALPLAALLAAAAAGGLPPWAGAAGGGAYRAWVAATAACLAGSVGYHCLMAHHHRYRAWLAADVCGIVAMLAVGGPAMLWAGLHCHAGLKVGFSAAYYAAAAAAARAALRARSAAARGAPMAALLGLRLAALGARLAVMPAAAALAAARWYVGMEALSLLGGALNAARVPERWLQPADPRARAPLDLAFNSHQIMHVLVAAAMYCLYRGGAADFDALAALHAGELECP